MNSKFFTLNYKDVIKGFIVAAITAALTGAYDALTSAQPLNIKAIATVSLTAGIGYLIKNVLTNSDGQIGKEQK